MIHSEEAEALMRKSDRALASARLLLDASDTDGACNRAYYAMFDAARAALLNEVEPEKTRTHRGLIAAFGLQLINTGRLPKSLGRMLNRSEEVRLLADYTGGSIELEDAHDMLTQAAEFIESVRNYLNDRNG